jgi:hypothetical protein
VEVEKRRAEGKLGQLRSSVKQAREAAAKHEKVGAGGRGLAAAGGSASPAASAGGLLLPAHLRACLPTN